MQLFLKLHFYISVLWCFWRISLISEFLLLSIGLKKKTRYLPKMSIFWFLKLKWTWICFFITILVFKCYNWYKQKRTQLNKYRKVKRQIPVLWSVMWYNHFDLDIIWITLLLLLKLHSNIKVLWRFGRIFLIRSFRFWVNGWRRKPSNT